MNQEEFQNWRNQRETQEIFRLLRKRREEYLFDLQQILVNAHNKESYYASIKRASFIEMIDAILRLDWEDLEEVANEKIDL